MADEYILKHLQDVFSILISHGNDKSDKIIIPPYNEK